MLKLRYLQKILEMEEAPTSAYPSKTKFVLYLDVDVELSSKLSKFYTTMQIN